MPRLIAGLLLLAAALALAACGGDDDGGADGELNRSSGPSASVAPSTSGPGDDEPTSPPTVQPTGPQPLYLALGDSLSAGIGASDELTTSWVPLVRDALGWDLLNLGVPGDDSFELLYPGGPLDQGLEMIALRNKDAVAGNEIGVITLEIGGNDLLDIYFDLVIPGDCPSLVEALQSEVCVSALENALADYRVNLGTALGRLIEAAPEAPVFLMTLYNPFSGDRGPLDEIGALALEGAADTPFPEGLNDIIREVGEEYGVHLVEWYEPFLGKKYEYIAQDIIHPNDTGHAVMADAVIAAMAQAGLPVVD
jgi:lysophospholipase L1-like esterase